MELTQLQAHQVDTAMEIINLAKAHLKEQGIDQWQTGYPDLGCIQRDAQTQKGYFVVDGQEILGYLCIDFDGEPAYNNLKGDWSCEEPYVVVHRMAFSDGARGRNLSSAVFALVESLSLRRGVSYFRVDTDEDNTKMQHILKKNGFTYRGKIWFDNSDKIAFDKRFA